MVDRTPLADNSRDEPLACPEFISRASSRSSTSSSILRPLLSTSPRRLANEPVARPAEDRLGEAPVLNAVSEAALESIVHGVVLVSLDGALIYANATARDILARNDGLSLGPKGHLLAARPDETRSLRALIAGCGNAAGSAAMVLSRPSCLRPLEVIAAPLSGGTSGRATPGALVFLRDPESQLQPMPELLAELYRLTPAEARLAAGLVSYRTLEEIAAEHRLSRTTLRTQLKKLFEKTGTNRQSELVGFLASGIVALQRWRVGSRSPGATQWRGLPRVPGHR